MLFCRLFLSIILIMLLYHTLWLLLWLRINTFFAIMTLKVTDQSNRTYEFGLILTCKHDGRHYRRLQILWSIALKLQIGKDNDKKESKSQKIYLLCFKWVPILWRIRSRHQYKTISKKYCMKIWQLSLKFKNN